MVAGVSSPRRVSGPFVEGAVALYLVHGRDAAFTGDVVLLSDALEAGEVVVRETRNVRELAADNCGSGLVFGLAGELVKGGHQDRTLVSDVLLAPGRRDQPLATYCVEQSRWHARGAEPADRFATSHTLAPTTMRTMLTRGTHQADVWDEVGRTQTRLGSVRGADALRDVRSATSLQLTLEDEVLRRALERRRQRWIELPQLHGDVVGHVVAVGGEVHQAEWFASSELHARLWPRLLDALLTDTVDATGAATLPTAAQVDAWIEAALAVDELDVEVTSDTVSCRLRGATTVCRQTLWRHDALHTVIAAA